jgi:hypothetical protein
MRQHFEIAGLDRPRLKEERATTMKVNFRSWRDTSITWLALAAQRRRSSFGASLCTRTISSTVVRFFAAIFSRNTRGSS